MTPVGVVLQPTTWTTFTGSALPSSWTSTPWATGGTGTVANGVLTVDGSLAASNTFYVPGQSMQFVATFSGDPDQHAGFAVNLVSAPWAIFSTMGGGALYARTNNGTTSSDVLLPGNWLNTPHLFAIDWTSTGVSYYIDGNLVATSSVGITTDMQPVFSDGSVGGGTVSVAAVGLTPFGTPGQYLLRVFDATQAVTWNAIQWTANVPASTNLAMYVRMGNTPTPDSSWTSFIPLANSGTVNGGYSRYLQYEAVMTTSSPNLAPLLENVTIAYSDGPDTIRPTVVGSTPASGATNVSPLGAISINFSEFMNPATISTSTVTLTAAGSTTPVPATVSYSGSTATLVPTQSLLGNTTYQVAIASGVTDSVGNTLGSNVSWTFTTSGVTVLTDSGSSFGAGTTGTGTVISQTNGGEVTLAPAPECELFRHGSAIGVVRGGLEQRRHSHRCQRPAHRRRRPRRQQHDVRPRQLHAIPRHVQRRSLPKHRFQPGPQQSALGHFHHQQQRRRSLRPDIRTPAT